MKRTPLRILFVEDNPDDVELISLQLQRAGFEVDAVRVDSHDAYLEAITTGQWDVILSDFQMPGFDGLQAFRLYRETGLDTPFIFVSGALGEERAVEAMRAGARDYILKGSLARLDAAVTRELAEAENRRRQRAAEEASREQQRRLAMAVEASGAGVFEYRIPASTDSYMSERWAEILGCRVEDLADVDASQWFFDRVHPEDRQNFDLRYQAFVDGLCQRCDLEARIQHHDGHWVDVAFSAKAIERDEGGHARQVVTVLLDLSERKRLEDQLRQAQKMEAVGRLAGGIAHDFNNLLTAIFSFGRFVLDELEPASPAHEDMQEVLKAAKKAASLTKQLLAFSRSQPVAPRVCDLNDILDDVDRMLKRLLGEDVELEIEHDAKLGNVRIDPSAFEQIILNLAINSRDAMPGGGRISIHTSNVALGEAQQRPGVIMPAGDYVQITVRDTGEGIDEEVQKHIFEPFFTTKEAGKGTGLGLSTCYGLVKQAGGFIWLESAPGQGACFEILLPRTRGSIEPATSDLELRSLRGSETILVAEDDEAVRKLIVRALSGLGYQVLEAHNGNTALAIGGAARIDLLITDVVMPGLSGRQLAERLRAESPKQKVLFVSGYTMNIIAERGITSPGQEVLYKPFTPEALARRVRNLLGR